MRGYIGLKLGTETNLCVQMFIAILCRIAKGGKQAKCLSASKWVNKNVGICTVAHYSGTTRNEELTCATTRVNLINSMSAKVDRLEPHICMIQHI